MNEYWLKGSLPFSAEQVKVMVALKLEDTHFVVYKIECNGRNSVYISQTNSALKPGLNCRLGNIQLQPN